MARSGGPIITAPTRRGFGMRLLSRALDQFGGTVETTFEPTGLICKLSAALTEKETASVEFDVTFYKRAVMRVESESVQEARALGTNQGLSQ